MGLRALKKMGFVSYKNCIAPSPWTGPSHASLFTGLMPSVHGIHETSSRTWGVRKLAKERLHSLRENLLQVLNNKGISTYGLSCNPWISPYLGYDFHHYKRFDGLGDVTAMDIRWVAGERYPPRPLYSLRRSAGFVKRGKVGLAARRLAADFNVDRTLAQFLGTHRLEKGSRYLLSTLRRLRLKEPFFLFVNLMECHDPYGWESHGQWCSLSQYSYITGNPVVINNCNWPERYPVHVSLGISRMIRLLSLLKPLFNRTMIIVTSDHGQSLGEHSRMGHGLFLEEELVRVPLYIRFPEHVQPVIQNGEFISLTALSALVQDVIEGGSTPIGSGVALSESFGPTRDLSKLLNAVRDSESIKKSLAHKIMIHSKSGTGVYNKTSGRLERSSGELTVDEARAYTDGLPLFEGERSMFEAQSEFTTEEEAGIRSHLRDLGYD